MRSRRARYVTVCQQSLVTGAVLVVAVSAAGVRTLDIVPAPGAPQGSQAAGAPALDDATVLRERQRRTTTAPEPEPATVDTAPVTPEVREVAVTGVRGPAGGRTAPEPATKAAPETAPRLHRSPHRSPPAWSPGRPRSPSRATPPSV